MKRQNPLTQLTLLFAVLLTLGATRAQADILFAFTARLTRRRELGSIIRWPFLVA
jgi:hypothetical protein